MAPLLALFLVALVGLPVAQALDCHVCAYNGENCFNPMRCPATVTYCMTTRTYYTPTRMKVSKSCVPSCFETVYDGYSKHASTTSCCQYDLCNEEHAVAPRTPAGCCLEPGAGCCSSLGAGPSRSERESEKSTPASRTCLWSPRCATVAALTSPPWAWAPEMRV
ncbi:Ly-6/neurotoxin-like protein 1 [Manis javanica]|nr:Ly-6/neurotoxin-like protein 1 [Manis javanica]